MDLPKPNSRTFRDLFQKPPKYFQGPRFTNPIGHYLVTNSKAYYLQLIVYFITISLMLGITFKHIFLSRNEI